METGEEGIEGRRKGKGEYWREEKGRGGGGGGGDGRKKEE